ncbi:MAG: hypothetical protein H7Z14_12455 [Anaerolineae bacterium]|nr:hypothetical protein [Phycisphaerae bacterium]
MSNDDARSTRQKNHRAATRALWVGAVLVVIGIILILSPFVWGSRSTWNKYFVAFGLIVTLLGAGMLLNGGLDWLRTRG